MTALEMIRVIAPEFSEVPDDTVKLFIQIVRPMVSRRRFGELYTHGIAYLVCHKLKLTGYGEKPLGDLGGIGASGYGISSVSEGGSSISFSANQQSNVGSDAELGLTTYGTEFLCPDPHQQ